MKKKNTNIKIGLLFALIFVTIPFLIRPSSAASGIIITRSVYAGEDCSLRWLVDPALNDQDTFSLVYSTYDGNDGDWIFEGQIDGTGWQTYSKTLNKLGMWIFKVEIYTLVDLGIIKIPIKIDTRLGYSLCIFPDNIKVDVSIMFDTLAIQQLLSKFSMPINLLPLYVEYALDTSYKQYWGDDIDFFTSYDPNWPETSYDPDWFVWDQQGDLAVTWFNDKRLPSGTGNGYYFEMMIYFTYNPNSSYLGSTLDDLIMINLAHHKYFTKWTSPSGYGVLSTLMHEVGHVFGITGHGSSDYAGTSDYDPTGEDDDTGDTGIIISGGIGVGFRRSVMDYYYGVWGYGTKFDQGHQNTIAITAAGPYFVS